MDSAEHLAWERDWWGTCAHTYGEETKQLTYARLMGLGATEVYGKWPVYDLGGRSVVDIGGGPISMLLKTVGGGDLLVVDPCEYPPWVRARYAACGIGLVVSEAETLLAAAYNEAWIYNVLQHVRNPRKVIQAARSAARRVRIFDWIETPPTPGHPHTLHAADLDEWLGGRGAVASVNENGCVGLAYFGVFPA